MSVLVNQQAPDFKAKAVVDGKVIEEYTLSQFKGEKYVVLVFYPFDFTFVCPTELHAFQEKLSAFEARNTQLVGVSIDSWHSHRAWLETPKLQGGIQGVSYPLVADIHKSISRDYDVLDEGLGATYRGVFIIDKSGVVQSQTVNADGLGRNIDEVLRTLDALQFTEEHGVVCPANWHKGDKTLEASSQGVKDYFN